ncbi:MAG TPA: DUF4157 domain-containing protein [Nocardioidaceae bacterium]|jgi:hypothetical protein
MRDHDHVSEESLLRPKGARIDDPVSAELGRAAAERRSDVLDGAGMLDLQRTAGNSGVSALLDEDHSPVHDVIASGGHPLDSDTRADMESRLGHDFGDVRVHDDGAAHESAKAVNAHAYTVGSNVVFQRDRYDPSSDAGRLMLAHELTHVVQQRSGPVDGTSAPGGIKVSDPSDRFEREASANAERVMATPASAPTAGPVAQTAAVQRDVDDQAPPAVQREDAPEEKEDEEEPVQGAFVQREEEEELEE